MAVVNIKGTVLYFTIQLLTHHQKKQTTMDNQYYVHLFSNQNQNYFPDNKASHFTCLLPETLHLHGRWYVGLLEMEYTYQIHGKERPLHLCVSTDICADSINGDNKLGLLRYLPVKGKKEQRVFQNLAPVQYILVNKQDVDRIEITINCPTHGTKEVFSSEPLRCALHFTKAPPFLL